MIDLAPELFDKDSALCGPDALKNGIAYDFGWAKKHGRTPGIAVLQVENASPEIARAVGAALKGARRCYDVAARIDARTFGVLLGCSCQGGTTDTITDALALLENAARAAAIAGGGSARARVFWLKPEHATADDWYREATLWHV